MLFAGLKNQNPWFSAVILLVKIFSHKFFDPHKTSLKLIIGTSFNPLSTMTVVAVHVTNSL